MILYEEPRLLNHDVYPDDRGWFMESYSSKRDGEFPCVQDNLSYSFSGVIRGIHYQLDGQRKIVRCVAGDIMDVVVDLRKGSSSYGQYYGFNLYEGCGQMLYVPAGFGHSFIALRPSHVMYKVDKYWNKEQERGVRFDDPEIDIPWKTLYSGEFVVSEKDKELPLLKDAETFEEN